MQNREILYMWEEYPLIPQRRNNKWLNMVKNIWKLLS